jgi:hypothetical protein
VIAVVQLAKEPAMHRLTLPAGSTIRLTATARPHVGVHRWAMRLLADDDSTLGPKYGSKIGGYDCDQRVDVPVQDKDRRLEVSCRHAVPTGWEDNRSSVEDDTPARLVIGYCNPSSPTARKDDVLLSFAFAHPTPAERA